MADGDQGVATLFLIQILVKVIFDNILVFFAAEFIVEFGENEFEYFFKYIHASIGEYLILHFKDDVFQ